jgi:hypothetical protein
VTRATLRILLNRHGIPVGPATDGRAATIVELVSEWGIMPGRSRCCDDAAVRQALDAAGIVWHAGVMIMVPRDQE